MTRGYFWAPLMRRERQPGIGERSIGVVLVPLGGTARVRVLPGNEDLDWAIAWIHATPPSPASRGEGEEVRDQGRSSSPSPLGGEGGAERRMRGAALSILPGAPVRSALALFRSTSPREVRAPLGRCRTLLAREMSAE
jgi:hypothetical protein